MTKFFSILIGENPTYTASFQPSSKRKIALYATCLMVPVILWFVNVYLLVLKTMELGMAVAIISAVFAALMIYLIERSILMSNGGRPIVVFRLIMGFLMALLGSISLDEVIFKSDIDNQMHLYKKAAIESAANSIDGEFQAQLNQQQANVSQKSAAWTHSLEDAKSEADGTGGSKQRMVGKIAMLKLDIAQNQANEYKQEGIKLQQLKALIEHRKTEARQMAAASFNESALLVRVKALFDLVSTDIFMAIIYGAFTLFLFCLEFLVVIIKTTSKKSIDEEIEEAREKLLRFKTNKIIERNALLYRPENNLTVIKSVNDLLTEIPTSLFN